MRESRRPDLDGLQRGKYFGQHEVSPNLPIWKSAKYCARMFARMQTAAYHIDAAHEHTNHIFMKRAYRKRCEEVCPGRMKCSSDE